MIYFFNNFCRSFPIYYTIYNRNGTLIVAITEMNVWWIMVSPIKRDNYSEESTDFRHRSEFFMLG